MIFRNEFPALEHTTYLNTASSGILSHAVHEWRNGHDLDFLQSGSGFRINQVAFLEGVRDQLSAFFNSDRKYTFLIPNFSSGLTTLLQGLTGTHRFLLLANEYPSVYYPIQSRGILMEKIPLGDDLEERIIEGIRRFQPTAFTFSLVQYSNGLKLDMKFIDTLRDLFPELLLIADGTQYCGTEAFDFTGSPLDVLIASGYKWMLGGYGNGFALLKEGIATQLYATVQSGPLPEEAFLKHKSALTLCFEPGHLDTLSFGTLQQSALFLNRVGYPFIENKLARLVQMAKEAFTDRGLLDEFISRRQIHSPIFKLNIPDSLIEKIQSANITGTARGTGFRVSFHFYNEAADLHQLLHLLDQR